MSAPNRHHVYVKSITHEADDVVAYELRACDEEELPPFTAGSHIDLIIDGIPLRSYSLLNDPAESRRYVIAVARDPKSRGGSRLIHETLRSGDTLQISSPKNHFPLVDGPHRSVLIAGGIGITPLWSMAQHLSGKGAAWELHYFARSHRNAALLERMQGGIECGDIHLLLARDVEATVRDIRALFGADDGERHYYCCGPSGMIEAYKALSQGIDGRRIHFESFVPLQEAATAGGYEVVLAKTGKTLSMEAGKSILDALGEAGVEVMNSCREGICGACEVRVIEGTPDHRDSILSDAEKQANRTMFVCCSGSRSPRLVLDL